MTASLALVILVAFLTLPYLIFSLNRLAHQEGLQELKPEKKAETMAYSKDYTKEEAPGEFTST